MQANKAKTQELQALKDEHSTALAKEKKRADDAENKVKANDGKLKEADQKSKDYAEELEKAQQKTDEMRTKAAEVRCLTIRDMEVSRNVPELTSDRLLRLSPQRTRPRIRPSLNLTTSCWYSQSWRRRSRSTR